MITCWFYRRLISQTVDADSALPVKVQRHIEACRACREFSAREHALARQLAAEAKLQIRTSSPFLHGKIMASLERVQPGIRESSSPFPRLAWAMALVILTTVLVAAYLRSLQVSADRAPRQVLIVQELGGTVSPSVKQNVAEWSKRLDQPLEAEMHSVVSDAKSALQLLAGNFLPAEIAAEIPRP